MKYLLIWTAFSGLCGLSLVSSPIQAQTCGSYRTYRTSYPVSYSYPVVSSTYVAPTYAAPTYVAPPVVNKVVDYKDQFHYLKFVAVVPLVELPTYSAVYTPPYSPVQLNARKENNAELKQILEMLKEYDNRFKAIENRIKGVAPQPAQPATPQTSKEEDIPDVKDVNRQACALCHQRGNESSGGKFILSEPDGSIVRLNNEQLGELDERLSTSQMPLLNAKAKAANIKALTDVQYAAWRKEISRQRALNKKKD